MYPFTLSSSPAPASMMFSLSLIWIWLNWLSCAMVTFSLFFLLGIPWYSWNCGFRHFSKFENFVVIMSSNFSVPFYSPLGTPITYVSDLLKLFPSLLVLYSLFKGSLFSLLSLRILLSACSLCFVFKFTNFL